MFAKPTYEELENRVRELERALAEQEAVLDRPTVKSRDENPTSESADQYRLMVEKANEAILVAQDGVFVFSNPKSEAFFGYSKRELGSRPLAEFIHEADRKMVEERHDRRLAGDTSIPDVYILRIISKSGGIRWVNLKVALFSWENRPAILCFMADITERKRAEEALRNALAEKEVLLREIHHRVKNNMQTIVGLLRMHARRIDNAQLTEIFNDCQNRIGAMSLIHEALYQSDDLAKIDFESYLKKLCRNLGQAHDAGRKGITLTANAANVSLNMDQGIAVGMIIAELTSNAFKHAFPHNEGGTVSVHLDRPGGETVRLVVSDTGKGLPDDFDIQNPSSLGMRLVAGAVTRELGGTIDVETSNGARFIIRFKQ